MNFSEFGIRGVGKRSLIDTLKRSKVFSSEKRIKLSQVPGEAIPEDNDDENGDNAFDKAEAFVERYLSIWYYCHVDTKSLHYLDKGPFCNILGFFDPLPLSAFGNWFIL